MDQGIYKDIGCGMVSNSKKQQTASIREPEDGQSDEAPRINYEKQACLEEICE